MRTAWLSLAATLAFAASVDAQDAVDIATGAAPVLDGTIGADEWAGSVAVDLHEGGEARFLSDGTNLYVAVRGHPEGWSHVYLGTAGDVRILHASAALGDVTYGLGEDGAWSATDEFAWALRDTTLSAEARAARAGHLEARGWVATTVSMGTPGEQEYAIRLDSIPEGARALVLQAADPERPTAWPAPADDVDRPDLVAGRAPAGLVFDPGGWGILRFDDGVEPALGDVPWPAPRSSHVTTWHGGAGAVVVYGGVRGNDARRLWAWNGEWWTVLDDEGPPPGAHFGLAGDAGRDRLVLQGGPGGSPDEGIRRYGETWEFDGGSWVKVTEGGPGARDHHAMVWDPIREVVVLFGGGRTEPTASGEARDTLLADTWSWDGEQWRRMEVDGPPARATHRMVFDERRGVALLFGGWGADGLLADTWAWNGSAWTRLDDGSGPSPRFATRLAYDAARGETVLFGGRGESGDLGDTWTFDGSAWTRRDVEGPSPRNVHGMAYDPVRERVVLFGGFHSSERLADVWEWDGAAWEAITPD